MSYIFKDRFQGKLISVYYSIGSNPLADWLVQCREGDMRTVQDEAIKSNVLQIQSNNVVACSITTPANPRGTLNVRLPYLTLQIKNLSRYFTFEVTILDGENIRRRFRASNYQTVARTSTFACSVPLRLVDGWNQVQFNLANFTERTYGTTYVETVRLSVHANCRLRRVYFSDRLYADDGLPDEYRLFRSRTPREKPARGKLVDPKAAAKAKAAAAKSKPATAEPPKPPATAEAKDTVAAEAHRPSTAEVHQPAAAEVHQPAAAEVHQPAAVEVHQPDTVMEKEGAVEAATDDEDDAAGDAGEGEEGQ